MPSSYKIAGISGSLREGSYNSAALKTLKDMAPDALDISLLSLQNIEPFNEDVEAEGWPVNVARLRNEVQDSEGVIIATPEYNYSVPGVLKNAIDWLSRPTGKSPLTSKPVGLVGASPSKVGTARAQAHLRQSLYYIGMPLLPTGEVIISDAAEKFDQQGRPVDDETRTFLQNFLKDFEHWVGLHAVNPG